MLGYVSIPLFHRPPDSLVPSPFTHIVSIRPVYSSSSPPLHFGRLTFIGNRTHKVAIIHTIGRAPLGVGRFGFFPAASYTADQVRTVVAQTRLCGKTVCFASVRQALQPPGGEGGHGVISAQGMMSSRCALNLLVLPFPCTRICL